MTRKAPAIFGYDPSAIGTFRTWEHFAQLTDQKWTNNSTAIDEYGYAYDYDGNRKYRQNVMSTTRSGYYAPRDTQ